MKEESELKTCKSYDCLDCAWQSSNKPYKMRCPDCGSVVESHKQNKPSLIDRPTPPVQAKTAEEIQKLDRCYNLLPCPFCGGKEGEAVVMGYKYPHYRASCMDCGYFISDDRTDKVVYHWNRRQFTPSESNWIPNLSEMDGQLVDKEIEISRLEEENKVLRSALNQDKTGLAKGLADVRKLLDGYQWICEGRGPYAWNDERYKKEVLTMLNEIEKVAIKALRESGTLATKAINFRVAKKALKEKES